jgi:hypothetical protein
MIVTTVTNCAPHPVKATFTSNGGPFLVQFHGSAWSSKGGPISADLQLDGTTIATAKGYTNEPSSHKALVLVNVFKCSVPAGTHTFTVVAGADTNLDGNDFFTITVFEYQVN